MEKKRFITIIAAFVLFSLLVNYFFIKTIFDSLNFTQGFIFYFLLILMSLSYPLTVLFERYKPMLLTKIFYRIASIWIGIAFFSICTFLFYRLLLLLFNIDEKIGSAVVLSFIVIMSFIALINGRRLKINLVDIEIKGLKKELKIVHLSDLHIGAVHQKDYLERVVKKTNSLNPDVVVITGDLVDGSTIVNHNVLSPINKIKSPVYFVIGNHEIYDGLDRVIPIFKKLKMKVLRDTNSKFQNINFIGIDYSDLKKEISAKLDKIEIDKHRTNILLYHAPVFRLKELERRGIALHLAGHTHDGQIFPFSLFVKLLYPYTKGVYKRGNSTVLVSPGTGTWGPPMRLGSYNEIYLINLRKKKLQ